MEMEQIFTFIDEASKKLNRQIKDLDDIRIAMATLKEIREHQISIDFQVGPIEVYTNNRNNMKNKKNHATIIHGNHSWPNPNNNSIQHII